MSLASMSPATSTGTGGRLDFSSSRKMPSSSYNNNNLSGSASNINSSDDTAGSLVREFWRRNPQGVDITAIFGPNEHGEIVDKIKSLDKSGDGFLSPDEFREALEEMASTQAFNKKSFKMLVLAVTALTMLIAAFGGLVYVVVELTKEVNVGDDNVMRSYSGNQPARLANVEFNVSDDGLDTRFKARTHAKAAGAARRSGEQASTQSSSTVATDVNRVNNLRTQAKDLFSMPPEALSDMTSITTTVKEGQNTTLVSVGVTGYTSNQITAARCGLTLRQLLFQTTDPLYPVLNVMYLEMERVGQEKYETVTSVLLTDEGVDKLKLRDGVPEYADICTGTLANGRRLLNVAYFEEMRDTSHELVSQGHIRGLLFWDAFVEHVVKPVANTAQQVVNVVVEVVSEVVEEAAKTFADVFGVDIIGEAVKFLLGGKSVSEVAGDIKNMVLGILGDVLKGLEGFVDWLPFDIFAFPKQLLNYIIDLGNQFMPGMEAFLKDTLGFLADWLYLDDRSRLCIGKGLSDATKMEYTSDDGLWSASMAMPQSENCFGFHWDEIQLDFDRIGACFKSIFEDNPIGKFVAEVVDEMIKFIPDSLIRMLGDIENMILNFIGDIFGAGARDFVQKTLDELDFTTQQIKDASAGRRRAILEAVKEIPDEGTPQHVRKLLLHHTATPHERRVFEEILQNVTHRFMLASLHKLYGANATLHPNAKTHSSSTDTSERRNLLFFTAQDIRNLAWFKSIPFSVSMGAEFVLTRNFDMLVDFAGDVMEHFGVPMLEYEGEFPVFTAITIKVGVRLKLKAPYEFVMVAIDSGIEFRLKLNMDTRLDIATGEIMASLDSSKGGRTGVRLFGSTLSGHAFAGFQVELGLDVGVCLATFCFDVKTNYTQDVFGMGYDFLMDPGKSEDFRESRNASASSSPSFNASSSRALLQNSPSELEAVKDRLKFQLQPTNRFYKYRDINFEKAAQCVLDAEREYFVGGAYMVSRWPMIEVKLSTPAEQFVGETAIPMVDWVLLDWNHRKYNPNALYSDFVLDGFVDGVSNFINDHFAGAAQKVFGFMGLGDAGEDLANAFAKTSIPIIGDALQFTATMAAANIPELEGILPPNIFQFGIPMFCAADLLPVEELWWTFPVYIPPLLKMSFDALTTGRRKLLGEENAVEPRRRRLVPPNMTCFSYGHPCSSSTECCGAGGDGSTTVVCGYSKHSMWALCLHKDDVGFVL
ncbi:hypothetical protein RI054_03g17980 [Pseudoscourfieldia marina]